MSVRLVHFHHLVPRVSEYQNEALWNHNQHVLWAFLKSRLVYWSDIAGRIYVYWTSHTLTKNRRKFGENYMILSRFSQNENIISFWENLEKNSHIFLMIFVSAGGSIKACWLYLRGWMLASVSQNICALHRKKDTFLCSRNEYYQHSTWW